MRLTEYQSNFKKDNEVVIKRNFFDLVDYRRRKKNHEIRHTPITWSHLDLADKIRRNTSNANQTLEINSKSVQANPISVETQSIGIQSPSKFILPKENKDYKKKVYNSPYNYRKHGNTQQSNTQHGKSKDVAVQSPTRVTSLEVDRLSKALEKKKQYKPTLPVQKRPIRFYGWADKCSPWQKKTYNVKAPATDVRQSALRAANYRKEHKNERQRFLTPQEMIKRKQLKQLVALQKQDAVTQFIQWETEYTSQFCK